METEERQQELLRRIQERLGPGDEDQTAEMNVLVAALAGLRAELGGLRADVGSLRAELTTLRAAMDSSVGRLSSELTATRTEAQDVNRRHDELAGRFDGLAEAVAQRVASARHPEPRPGTAVAERLAAVEGSLDGLAEGLQALTRDGVGVVGDRVAALEGRIASLADLARAQQSAAQDRWPVVIRAALTDLASAIDRDLGALGTSLTRVMTATHDAGRTHLEKSLDALVGRVEALLSDVNERVGAVGELHRAVAALGEADSATQALVHDEVGTLRGDLADALEEVRDRITAALGEASDSISGAVKAQRSSYDELVAGVQSAAKASGDTSERMHEVAETVVALDAAVTALRADWSNRTHAVVAAAERAARAATDEFRRAAEAALGEVHEALEDGAANVGDGVTAIAEATARLVRAGQALLGYLAERDLILENERDRILREVFDAFGEGLSDKQRRWASGRLADALDRRRDLRDAERWRRVRDTGEPIEVPTPPQDLAALAAPAPLPAASRDGPSPSPGRRKKPAATPAAKPPVRPPARSAAKAAAPKPPGKRSAKKPPAKKPAAGKDGKPAASRGNGTAATAAAATATARNGVPHPEDPLSAPVFAALVVETPQAPEITGSEGGGELPEVVDPAADGRLSPESPDEPGEASGGASGSADDR